MSGDPGFGIYVHWPYCASICPYCDFNVRRDRGGDHADLLRAIEADLRAQAQRIGRRDAGSLFIGGGTPSLLSGGEIAALIEAADRAFGLARDCEITLECNPEHAAGFPAHRGAGVNRFSLGVQALSAPALLHLGRRHSVAEAERAVVAAAETGARVSIDLIYARDHQSTDEWSAELARALALPVEHASLYQLTIEAGTPFARAVQRGRMRALESDAAAALYSLTQAAAAAAGFDGYEISNHARGAAAQSRHNLVYWRGGEWVGVGPGAHGRLAINGARTATQAFRDPGAYVRAVSAGAPGWEHAEALDDAAYADELLLMGLRLAEGLDRERWERLRGAPANAARLQALAADDLLYADDRVIRLTGAGRLVADRIAAELSA